MAAESYILALLNEADQIPSHTMLQKLVYLAADLSGGVLPFAAHFYGPYSSSLQG